MLFTKTIVWSCPVQECRKAYVTVIPLDGEAQLLCSVCGYTSMVKFFPAPPAEPMPTDPNDPKFQAF